MNAELQRQLAAKAGDSKTDGPWSELYDHHLGMVETPLPFGQFRLKYNVLTNLLTSDPDGKRPSLDRQIMSLSLQLGF